MAYDDKAKRVVIKAIGTAESEMTYDAINYNDPITVGLVQWYGPRAANVLSRMKHENVSAWQDVAASIDNDLAIPSSDTGYWTTRYLTQTEGESLRPVLLANKVIQNDQVVVDLEDYRQVAVNIGLDPEGNTNPVLFWFTIYHQSPQSAYDIANAATGTLEDVYNAALAHPVVGQYSNRQTTVYTIIKNQDDAGVEYGDGSTPTDPDPDPTDPPPTGDEDLPIHSIHLVGDALHIKYVGGKTGTAYPTGRAQWLPGKQPTGTTAPPPDPDPDPDPTPTGDWFHPLPGATKTSPFGPRDFDGFHYGQDWSTGTGTVGQPCLAATDLKVTHIIREGDGEEWMVGNCVKAQTIDGAYTFSYFHLSSIDAKAVVGATIPGGQPVGVEGATGNVTGLHLHFECYNGAHVNPWQSTHTPIDPIPVLNANGVTT